MVQYKLTYFNARGRAEISRLILAAAGVKYEDERLQWEQWSKVKPTTPFGLLPVLTIDGKTVLAESMAIARYLAKSHGLSGKNLMEEAKADMIFEGYHDLGEAMVKVVHEKDPDKKEELGKKLIADTVPKYVSCMEKLLTSNKEGKAYMVGDGLTFADLVSYNVTSSIMKDADLAQSLEKAPVLRAHMERIAQLPRVKTWLETRPKTDM